MVALKLGHNCGHVGVWLKTQKIENVIVNLPRTNKWLIINEKDRQNKASDVLFVLLTDGWVITKIASRKKMNRRCEIKDDYKKFGDVALHLNIKAWM